MTHLHAHTVFSTYDGISTCQEMIDQAVAHEHKSLAITNHGLSSMGDLLAFQRYAKEKGIKPILGNEAYIVDELVSMNGKKRVRTKNNHIILLAKNKKGWENLCHLSYIYNLDEQHFYYKPRITFEELFEYKEGLMVGSACLASPFSNLIKEGKKDEALELLNRFHSELGENFYAEIQLNEIVEEQKVYNDWLIEQATQLGIPIVITGDIHYATPEGAITQNFMFNLRKEEDSEGDDTYRCKSLFYQSVDDFKNFNKKWNYGYSDEQIDTWCSNTDKIAEQCNFEIEAGIKVKLPRFSFNEEEDFVNMIKEGLSKHFNCKYEECPEIYRKRVEEEVTLLLKKGAYRYMMIVSMLVNHAKDSGYIMGPGRGSCSGSVCACCLGITSWIIDPIEKNLLFNRFVSEHRMITNRYNYFGED